MMERMTAFLLRHKRIVLLITCALFALSLVGVLNISVNSDISSYLPDNMTSRRTMTLLSEKFDIHGDAQCVIEGDAGDYEAVKRLAGDIQSLDQVNTVLWLGTYDGIFNYTDAGITSAVDFLSDASVQKLVGDCIKERDGKAYYMITLALTVPNSGSAAGKVMDKVLALVDAYAEDTSADCFVGGNAMQSKGMLDSALGELPQFLMLATAVIAVILLLTSKSLMSSAIFLITIGVSIVFNMGTNFMTASISSITFSVAAILQLAMSMDYSIFLTHAYERASAEMEPEKAMAVAVKRTSSVILASALTTVAGFCALFAMEFKLGFDLGLCLAKGVTLSYITVIIVQPCLMLFFRRACEKTQHRTLEPKFNLLYKLPDKLRYAALIFCCVVVVPATLLASGLQFYYLDSNFDSNATGAQAVAQDGGNQTVFVTKKVSDTKQFELLEKLRAEEADGAITSITGYYSMLDSISDGLAIPLSDIEENGGGELTTVTLSAQELADFVSSGDIPESVRGRVMAAVTEKVTPLATSQIASRVIIESMNGAVSEQRRAEIIQEVTSELQQKYQDSISAQITAYAGGMSGLAGAGDAAQTADAADMAGSIAGRFFADVDGEQYTYFMVRVNGQPEGDVARGTVARIQGYIDEILGASTHYAASNSQVVTDLSQITVKDFAVVSILSALLILIILFITFRRFAQPLLLVALIELAIQINLAIPALQGASINFMSYIIISAIQLGATIDYAILYTNNYHTLLNTLPNREAAKTAVRNSAYSILISMSILTSACMSVYLISSDEIIREITGLIARGSLISAATVLIILPALFCLKRDRKKSGAQVG